MKLLIYSHFFAPSVGGVETIVFSLAQGLAELRNSNDAACFEVTLVTQTPPGKFRDSRRPFHVVRQPSLFQLWRLIRSSDVVHVAGPALAPLILGHLAGKPLVVEHHGYQAVCPNGVLLHQPDHSVCPGHFQARDYGECLRCLGQETAWHQSLVRLVLMLPRYWLSRRAAVNVSITQHALVRLSLPHSILIYHGVEDPLGAPAKNLHAAPLVENAGAICFAYLGRLVPEKGIPVLLEAARLLRGEGQEFQIRLIGDGPERPNLEAIIGQDHLEACVSITGFLTNQRLVEALAGVDVIVMPSVWEETAGLAAIQQMMRGKLVIASEIGGLAEIVADTGLTFTPGHAEALTQCMKKVLQDRSLIGALGQTARNRALGFFRRERMIKDHARTYRKLQKDVE